MIDDQQDRQALHPMSYNGPFAPCLPQHNALALIMQGKCPFNCTIHSPTVLQRVQHPLTCRSLNPGTVTVRDDL